MSRHVSEAPKHSGNRTPGSSPDGPFKAASPRIVTSALGFLCPESPHANTWRVEKVKAASLTSLGSS